MFALSEGVRRTGALRMISGYFDKIGELSFSAAMLIIMAIIGVISAFINNTAAVVIFIPVLMAISKKLGMSPSKILLPLSFASMFGGVCTLLGTSTNILVSSIAVENGLPAFSMFEFAPFGLLIVATGFIYLFIIGIRMTPPRRKSVSMMSVPLFEPVSFIPRAGPRRPCPLLSAHAHARRPAFLKVFRPAAGPRALPGAGGLKTASSGFRRTGG